MPKIDFSTVPDQESGSFEPIPDGNYLMMVEDVQEKTSSNGNELWSLRLKVQGGEHKGRLVFDNLVFTLKALPRLKLACRALEIPVDGEIDLTSSMLLGRMAVITVIAEEYEAKTGEVKNKNVVTFDGYSSPKKAENKEGKAPEPDSFSDPSPETDLPF